MIGKNNSQKPEDKYSIVPWSSGTDKEIVAMVAAADAGKIDLTDYWSVGDTRSISLSAMDATYVGESQPAQTVDFVLMDTTCAGFIIAETSKKPSFIVGMKNLLSNYGYINSIAKNANGWFGCERRNWCNNIFYYAIPLTLRPIFKRFTWKTGKGGGGSSGLLSCNDCFALPPEKAVFGLQKYSQTDESELYNQWEYYQTSSNRVKYNDTIAYAWWGCSPVSGSASSLCVSNRIGFYDYVNTNCVLGISPFGCI